MSDENITRKNTDVYMTRVGPWNPDHGELEIPDDWELLPSGDALVTRRVKAGGTYWIAWRPWSGRVGRTQTLSLEERAASRRER